MIETDLHKVIITAFTDPMMGLSYESEPTFRRLETHFGKQIELRYCMSLLVRDVKDFMLPQEIVLDRKKGIDAYCKRLACIYEEEEAISGMPICMEHFRLFDDEHTTSLPLNLACKTVELIAPVKTEHFLYMLRYATVVDGRPTTHFDEIIRLVDMLNIDKEAFIETYQNGAAEAALTFDLNFAKHLGVHFLPAYLLQYNKKEIMLNTIAGYDDFKRAIFGLTEGKIYPQVPELSEKNVEELIINRKLICSVELKAAFALHGMVELNEILKSIKQKGVIEIYPVKDKLYIKAK